MLASSKCLFVYRTMGYKTLLFYDIFFIFVPEISFCRGAVPFCLPSGSVSMSVLLAETSFLSRGWCSLPLNEVTYSTCGFTCFLFNHYVLWKSKKILVISIILSILPIIHRVCDMPTPIAEHANYSSHSVTITLFSLFVVCYLHWWCAFLSPPHKSILLLSSYGTPPPTFV